MNSGPDIIGLSNQANYIGYVTSVCRIEGEPVEDKLGVTLRPFEILFNVADIITGARAAPLALNSEVNVGDAVYIFSMESIYNSTFFYIPVRNINSPRDTIKLKYNNALIEFRPDGTDDADLLLSAANNLIAINSLEGTITLDSLNGVRINGGSSPIDIRNDSQELHTIINELMDILMDLTVIIPSGEGMVSPDTVNKLLEINGKFDDLFGEVDATDAYPIVPDNTFTKEFLDDVVREQHLDALTDEGEYKKGDDAVIDDIRDKYPTDYPTPVSEVGVENTVPPTDVPTEDVDCPVGPFKNNLQLSTNFTLADLTVRTFFPHKLRAQAGLTEANIVCNLKALATNIIEPLKAQYPAIRLNSVFRAKPSIPGGVSQHEKGEAVDIQIAGLSPSGYMAMADWIKANLPFDQLIFEHGNSIWIHISHKRNSSQRKQLLTMFRGKYTPGLRLHY